jgi:uncharacterized protein
MYHRLARRGRYRWWKPIVELVLFAVLVIGLWLAVILPLLEGLGPADNGAPGLIKLGLTIACFTPAAILAARIMGRPWGALLSVADRFRGRWFATCLLITLGFVTASTVIGLVIGGGPERGGWVGWSNFWPLAITVLLVIPLQASAEEFAFRGTLMQAVGAYLPWPWVSIVITSVIFGAAHALPLEGFVAITTFGLVAGWLTIRTGGLEAAIALHVLNNVTFFLLDAATGRGDIWVTELNEDITWSSTLVDVAINLVYGYVIAKAYSRRALSTADGTIEPLPRLGG